MFYPVLPCFTDLFYSRLPSVPDLFTQYYPVLQVSQNIYIADSIALCCSPDLSRVTKCLNVLPSICLSHSIKNVLHSAYCYRHFNVLSSVLCYKPHNVLNYIALGYTPHSIGLTYRPGNVLQNVYPVLPCVSDNRYKCKISYLTCCNKLNQTKLLQPEHQTRL